MYFKNTRDHRPFWTSEVTLVLHVLSSTSPFLSLWGPADALHPPSAEGASCYMGKNVQNNFLVGLILEVLEGCLKEI